MNGEKEKISCAKCKHYYVTWDKDFPYGCKAMGFKSKTASMIVVYQSSGIPCRRYEPKTDQGSR